MASAGLTASRGASIRFRCRRRLKRCWPRVPIVSGNRPSRCYRLLPLSVERCRSRSWSVTNLRSANVAEGLLELRRAELLHELPSHEPGLHAFRHPLIQEVAYRSLLHERRRALHGAVARAMEAQFKGRQEERAGLLAYHLEQAGELLQAAQANMRAAFWFGANDASQALRTWRKVRE